MKIMKVTQGYAIQTYDTKKKKWIKQEFVAEGEVTWQKELKNGLLLTLEKDTYIDTYLPFDMKQP